MTLTFYVVPNSTASVTEAVLAELDIAHGRIILEIGPAGTQSVEFLRINPNGRVPTIVHDGVVLWESAAITLHLGETFGVAAGLFPPPGLVRARAMSWVVWCSVNLAEAGGRLAAALDPGSAGGVVEGSADARIDESLRAAAEAQARVDLARLAGILDAAFAEQPFLCGSYTLADTHLAVIVGWLQLMAFDLAPYPALDASAARCAERPALAWLAA